MLYYVLFFFLAMGAKLGLALVMIYLLLPSDRRCNHCDEETLLMQMSPGHVWLSRLCLGKLQRRWCPSCRWEGYAQTAASVGRVAPANLDRSTRRPNDAREFLN